MVRQSCFSELQKRIDKQSSGQKGAGRSSGLQGAGGSVLTSRHSNHRLPDAACTSSKSAKIQQASVTSLGSRDDNQDEEMEWQEFNIVEESSPSKFAGKFTRLEETAGNMNNTLRNSSVLMDSCAGGGNSLARRVGGEPCTGFSRTPVVKEKVKKAQSEEGPKRLSMLSEQFRKRFSEGTKNNLPSKNNNRRGESIRDLSLSLINQNPKAGSSKTIAPIPTNNIVTELKSPVFRTPEKSFAGVSRSMNISQDSFCFNDDDDELESSIVVDDSPVKIVKQGGWRRSSAKARSTISRRVETRNDELYNQSQLSESLSGQISEDPSTQSSSASSVKTPMAIWVHQDQTAKGEDSEIKQFESPNKNVHMELVSGEATRRLAMKSLLESFKSIKTRYDSSARLFSHDFRSGKYDGTTALNLVIRKVVDRHDKLLKTVVYDLQENRNRWIFFKPVDPFEIIEGVCLKLFSPWQEIFVPGTSDSVIIGADFYKIFRKSEFNITDQRLKDIKDFPLPSLKSIRISDPLFMNLVPSGLKNKNTIHKQLKRFPSLIDVDIVVLNTWKAAASLTCLVKDSDNFLSLLDVPQHAENLIAELSPGRCFKLKQLIVADRVSISEKLSLFSILHLFGSPQTYYYMLSWSENESKSETGTFLNIPMVYPREKQMNVEEIYTVTPFQDQRVSLTCRIEEKKPNYALVSDDESGRTLRIEFIAESCYPVDAIQSLINEKIHLKFLRLIHGKAIWDNFTMYLLIDEDLE